MALDHLSWEWAIQDSTVVVTLEALAKAADDLRDACTEARNNPQTVTAGMGSGTVRISTKQPHVAAPLVLNGNAKKESIKEAVISDFKGGAQVEIAQAKIEALYQGKATATMFFTVLDTLNQAAGFDMKALQAIYAQPTLPTDYAGWKSTAIKHDGMHCAYATVNRSMRVAKHSNRPVGFTGGFGAPNQNVGFGKKPDFSKMVLTIQAPLVDVAMGGGWTVSAPAAVGTSMALVPMDIDRATSQPTASRNKPVCFACGKEGHIQRNCPIYLAKNPQFQAVYMDAAAKQDK
ncbi:hypothetical protein C8J57DRAFT_1536254 [Mycena rebaudengoi]|nr:hypothetical protein C8J57DRAFT_1536254 [Mycena rebaudengoi]